ncbi:hypothetical protein [uncultured Aquimarina sp.]|uniref:hypothetical protein n=1 Tax=uncultured Aquimarina sp. TaxID=575652 RepID=UPI00260F571E|nr:hypothetical protein [uncultured Aquimarina sp.]
MNFYKSNSLYSLQTKQRNEFTKDLQKTIAIHPNGHFVDQLLISKQTEIDTNETREAKAKIAKLKNRLVESAETIPFNRYRSLKINWDDIIQSNIYDSNLELRFVKKMFEDSWGQKPDDKKSINKFYYPTINVNEYYIEHNDTQLSFSSLGIPSVKWMAYTRLFKNGDEIYLMIGKDLNFTISNIEVALENVTYIAKVHHSEKLPFKPYDNSNPSLIDQPEIESFNVNSDVGVPIRIGEIPEIGRITIPPRYRNIRIEEIRDIEIPNLDLEFFKFVEKISSFIPEEARISKAGFKTIINEWVSLEDAQYKIAQIIKTYNADNFEYKLYTAKIERNEYREISIGKLKSEGADENNNHWHTISVPKFKFEEVPQKSTVVIDIVSDRHYLLEFEEGSSFIENSITSNSDWEKAWDEDIVNVQLLHKTNDHDDSGISDRYAIGRNEARLILEKYRLLKAEGEVLDDQIKILQKSFESTSNAESITYDRYTDLTLNALSKRLLELKKRSLEIKQLLNELQSDASSLGYKLFLETPTTGVSGDFYQPYKNEHKAPEHIKNLKIKKPEPGNLYKVTLNSLIWTENHQRRVKKKKRNGRTWSGRRKYKWVTVTITEKVERKDSYTSYIPINPGEEIWETHKTQLITRGKHVHVLKKVKGEYVTDNGPSLIDLMDQAIVDDDFRKNLVVFVPVYDYSFSAGNVITHYDVINKPMPGIAPISFPEIHIKEHLEYRKILAGTELGELSSSIALSPGEKREITYKRSFENKLDKRKTVKNFLDISTGNETSFEQKLEDEIRTESNDNSQDSSGFNLTGSASDGSNSGSASYSENSNDSSSLSEFTKEFESTADRAARKYSKSIKEETVQDFSEVISSSNEESVSMSLENINQGVSLNLLFHKLYNAYFAGTFVKDFELQITHPIEIIQDSGITHKVVFNRKEGRELNDYLKDFILTSSFGVTPEEETEIFKLAYQSIVQVIHNDYLVDLDHVFVRNKETSSSTSNEIMIDLKIKNEPINTHFINLPSKATYVDSVLGVNPSTEPYSEAMREEQLRRASMETKLIEAKAAILHRNSQLRIVDDNEFSITENDNIVRIQFLEPLSEGNWLIMLDDRVLDIATNQVQEITLSDSEAKYELIRVVDLVYLKEIPQRI